MATTYKLKNISGAIGEWGGIDFAIDEIVILSQTEVDTLRKDESIFEAVASSELEVHGDTQTFSSPIEGWNYFEGDTLPKSSLEGSPLAVHTSYKPNIPDGTTYAIWSGAGDDMTDAVNGNGNGPLLHIVTEVGTPQTIVDIEFNRIYGRIWLHEAYLKFTGGGMNDSITSVIMSYAVPLQQSVSLDLTLDGEWIKYSVSGPGTGTHGFADPEAITLVDRDFQADGDWNYDATSGLTPNFAGTGRYKMSNVEQVVHRYVNRVPVYGDCATYFSMSSDETTELQPGYFARVIADNQSNTVWHCSVLMELYREVTYSP